MGSAGTDDGFVNDLEVVIFDDGDDGGATGQTCRMALLFSALTLTPIKVVNVMSGDPKRKTQGMTRHLVELVRWFQTQTAAKDAKVYEIGETTLELTPTQRANSKVVNTIIPLKGSSKNKYREDTTKLTHQAVSLNSKATNASAVITLQTVLPLLLMTGNHTGIKMPRELLVEGATNCPDAPSFEYLKQVFAPALLQYFGLELDCHLEKRGWGVLPVSKGLIRVKFTPLPLDTFIQPQKAAKLGISEEEGESSMQRDSSDVTFSSGVEVETEVQKVVATIVAPLAIQEMLQETARLAISRTFNLDEDDATSIQIDTEKSDVESHVYVLLVAHSDSCRWGRDWMNSESMGKRADLKGFATEHMLRLCADLEKEVSGASECPVDQFLQDQLIVYQALAKGSSSFQRQQVGNGSENGRPLDSEHVRRARITAEKMLGVKLTEAGALCVGAGVKAGEHVKVNVEKKQQLEKQAAIQFA